MSNIRSCLLPSHMRCARSFTNSNFGRLWCSHRWISSSTFTYHFPLYARYWALALWMAAWLWGFYMFAVGVGVRCQFFGVACVWLFAVWYTDCYAEGVGDAQEEKDTACMYPLAWYIVSCTPDQRCQWILTCCQCYCHLNCTFGASDRRTMEHGHVMGL